MSQCDFIDECMKTYQKRGINSLIIGLLASERQKLQTDVVQGHDKQEAQLLLQMETLQNKTDSSIKASKEQQLDGRKARSRLRKNLDFLMRKISPNGKVNMTLQVVRVRGSELS